MSSSSSSARSRRGGVLVEFALVSFALYLVLAAILDMGRAVMAAQLLQSAADQMARELAVAPLPGTMTFEDALEDVYVKQRIFDASKLVVELTPGLDIEAEFATYPVVNQMLRPLMIWDKLPDDQQVLRYPGALVQNTEGYGVLIPRISVAGGDVDVIEWLPVVEEVLPTDDAVSHFPINAPLAAFRGNVVLRLNYPFQAATMSSFDPAGAAGPFGDVVLAPEDGDIAPPDEGNLVQTSGTTASQGPAGLGYHYAFGKKVLPYRKLISVRSFHRRENYGG